MIDDFVFPWSVKLILTYITSTLKTLQDAAMSACSTTERTHSATVDWQPADLIRRRKQTSDEYQAQDSGFALVVLNQPLHAQLGVVRRIWNNGKYFLLVLANKVHSPETDNG